MLILAAVVINLIVGDNGILTLANKARISSKFAEAKEKLTIEATTHIAEYNTSSINGTIQAYVQSEIESDYNGKKISGVSVTVNEIDITLEYSNNESTGYIDTAGNIIWEDGYSEQEQEDSIGDITPEESTYKKVGETYLNSPDLSNLNPEATYYVTYDENGENPTIYGRIDRVEAPEDWYDYENQKWANIVTVTNDEVAYWVWIPRYKYITNSSSQTVDIKFVSIEDKYINSSDTEEELEESYKLSDAFTFGETELTGYWMSKYEVTDDPNETIGITAQINTISVSTSSTDGGNYTVFVNGEKKYTGTLPYKISGLKAGREYDICVAKGGTMLSRQTVSTKTITVDLSNLNPEATYYVTYDENGENPTIYGRIDKVEAPEDWYDYANKKWANIVTVTNDEVAYWVWIPRYAYNINPNNQTVSIEFVTTDVVNNEDSAYVVSDAFTFNGVELAGYWMSKYEVTEYGSENIGVTAQINTITVTTDNTEEAEYTIFLDGEKIYTGSLPYYIENVEEGKEYDVCVANGGTMLSRRTVSTKTITIDLSGLNPKCTYYVYWDEEGTEHNDIPISEPAPENWYDYSEKKWANIVTKGEDGNVIAYWVYIPRYAYRTDSGTQKVSIVFVTTDVVNEEDSVYKVSDAFTFNGVELAGYWISKYEVSE